MQTSGHVVRNPGEAERRESKGQTTGRIGHHSTGDLRQRPDGTAMTPRWSAWASLSSFERARRVTFSFTMGTNHAC